MMSFFRKLLIGKVGISIVIMGTIIFFVIGASGGNGGLYFLLAGLITLIAFFGLLEYTQIDLGEGLIRKKIFFYGLTFGTWHALEDFDYLTIDSSSMHVADNVAIRTGSYNITSRFLILGIHDSDFNIIIKKGSPSELKEIGKTLKNHFPHLELINKKR